MHSSDLETSQTDYFGTNITNNNGASRPAQECVVMTSLPVPRTKITRFMLSDNTSR